jgi:hypothetical protein
LAERLAYFDMYWDAMLRTLLSYSWYGDLSHFKEPKAITQPPPFMDISKIVVVIVF